MSYELKTEYAKNFKRFGTKRSFDLDSIEIHSIGCAQNTASAIAQNMSQNSPDGIVHSLIDADSSNKNNVIIQILPDDNVAWADAGYGNNHSFTIEIAESDYMRYTGGANYIVTNQDKFEKDIKKGYAVAVEYVADLCKKFGFDPEDKLQNGLCRVYSHREANLFGLASAHVDPTHIWDRFGYTMDGFRKDVKAKMSAGKTQAKDVGNLPTEAQRADRILSIVKPIAEKYGLFPSVAAAQTILESGFCTTDLATEANNVCGMKTNLSGNTWPGSTWDGWSKYTKKTQEQDKYGNPYLINADFRRYACMEDSIADRCAYLLGAMNGSVKRYEGITKCKDFTEQATLIKLGGYATDLSYVSKLASLISRFNLDRYDSALKEAKKNITYKVQLGAFEIGGNAANMKMMAIMAGFSDCFIRYDNDGLYRVQIGSYSVKENAEKKLKMARDYILVVDGNKTRPFKDAFIKVYEE